MQMLPLSAILSRAKLSLTLLSVSKLSFSTRFTNNPVHKVSGTLSLNRKSRDVFQSIRFLHMESQRLEKVTPNTSKVPLKEDAKDEERQSSSNNNKKSLKQAVRDYGGTVIVFHACLSILSFGISYVAVSSGLDVISVLEWLGLSKSILESRFTAGASTIVISYALYKVFSPLRVACTLTATPFLVRYLRRKGFLKSPGSH